MQRIGALMAVLLGTLVAALAFTNWQTLATPTQVNLLVTRMEAPLGLLMLALTAALFLVFIAVTLHGQFGSLLESRRLLKEVQRLRGLADQAETSRIENLHQLIATEFRLLNERVSSMKPPAEEPLVRLP